MGKADFFPNWPSISCVQQDAMLLGEQEKKEISPPGKGGFKPRAARNNLSHYINLNRLQKALSAA